MAFCGVWCGWLSDDDKDGTVSVANFLHVIHHQGGELLEQEMACMLQDATDCHCVTTKGA
eukprot:COSAG05_NODE_1333_length_5152_cov_4.935484_6_plen_60_part_00